MSRLSHPRGLLASAVSFSMLAFGATAGAVETAVIDAPEMLVPGTRLPVDVVTVPASITIIDQTRIAASPAQTVTDLLALEAGINVRSLFGNRAVRSTVDLRGFGVTGGQNTLILLDGRRLNDVDLSAVNFAALPLYNIERIEVTRGVGSVLYGDGASAGTINIVTRGAQTGGPSGVVGLSGGSYSTGELKGRLGFSGEKTAVSLAVDALESDGERDNNDLSQRNLQLELRRSAGDTLNIYAKAGFSDQELRLPGVRTVDPNINLNELRSNPDGTANPNDYADERNGYLTVGFSRDIDTDAGMIVDAGYRRRGQQAFFDDYAGGGLYADYLDSELSSVSITPRAFFGHSSFGYNGRLTFGIDVYDYDYASDRSLNRQTIGRPIHRLRIDQRSTALYLNDLSQLTERLTTTLGARIQRMKLSARDGFDGTAPGAVDKFESGAAPFAQEDTEGAYEAGARFTLNEAFNVFARGGRSVRFATVDELFEFGPTFTREFSPLKPQRAKSLDLGLGYKVSKMDGSLTLYGMDLTNEIHFNPVSFANENLDPTRRWGAEFEVGVQALPNLSLRANYSLLKARFRSGAFAGKDVPVVPSHLANLSAQWSIATNVALTTTWRHVGPKRFDNDENNNFSARIPKYDMVNTKLSGTYRNWSIAATVNNVFDKQTFDYGVASTSTQGRFNAYPLPGRNFLLEVSRQFD